ncbi:hypothetical protein UUU_35450 [Klebsiella pneumoniae subsp. pneumoniae DSM 30104 = JCM 1662 = NBRC 14940]|nr:hypothetical protein UUU_35450 [Klebsiella pneumoniae subsp. pneumoniae DSM 30104 = JCM 1662 = NBRC 14940]
MYMVDVDATEIQHDGFLNHRSRMARTQRSNSKTINSSIRPGYSASHQLPLLKKRSASANKIPREGS